jgi:RNA polymerase sigma-70 factor (ECF subfamily)
MVLGSRADCDDVVAEVFVRLWTSPGQFDPDRGSLLGFLRLRAKGRSIDILRCESNRKRREDNDAYSDNLPGPDVESTVIAAEAAAELARAIAALPASEQEAIRLAYFGGMSYRAVALHLEEPEGTVKSRIRVGLQHLRSRTGELGSA